MTIESREGWGRLVVMNSSWPLSGGRDCLLPEGSVGGDGTFNGEGGHNMGAVILVSKPLLDPCPL